MAVSLAAKTQKRSSAMIASVKRVIEKRVISGRRMSRAEDTAHYLVATWLLGTLILTLNR